MFFMGQKTKVSREHLAREYLEFEGVRFQVRRVPRRRMITITLKPNGYARISAAVGCSDMELRTFLAEKKDWIRMVSAHFGELRQKYPKLEIKDGTELPLLGKLFKISIEHVKQ